MIGTLENRGEEMRLRNIPNAEQIIKEFDHYAEALTENKGNWSSKFEKEQPLYVEFGGGKGGFAIGMADMYKDVNFISVDAKTEVLLKACEKAEKAEVNNVRFTCLNVLNARDYFNEGEIDRIYLNFSDPWPKKRHYKRRLTYRGFLDIYKDLLKPGGEIHFKTDNRSLFEFTLNEFAEIGVKMKNISLDLHSQEDLVNVMTEYEAKFSKRGFPIFRLEANIDNLR